MNVKYEVYSSMDRLWEDVELSAQDAEAAVDSSELISIVVKFGGDEIRGRVTKK